MHLLIYASTGGADFFLRIAIIPDGCWETYFDDRALGGSSLSKDRIDRLISGSGLTPTESLRAVIRFINSNKIDPLIISHGSADMVAFLDGLDKLFKTTASKEYALACARVFPYGQKIDPHRVQLVFD
jgi:hypothetical protein